MSQKEQGINPLAYWRAKRDWSVEFLAQKSGVGKATITRIENWKVKPNLRTLMKLAEALEIDIEQITELADLPKNQPVTAKGLATKTETGWQITTPGVVAPTVATTGSSDLLPVALSS